LNNNPRGNNNNNNNNRRRGRGNNRPSGGGGQQLNRIDSRARGNAPQLLEKYRKQAHDAHLNGDRVTAEYYLQFADHYFRVIADARVRSEEQRQPRSDKWQEGADDSEDSGDYGPASDFPSFEQQQPPAPRRDRDDRPPRDDREPREERAPREPRPPREDRAPRAPQTEAADEGAAQFEPAENPFMRGTPPEMERDPVPEVRSTRGLRPRRDDRRPPRPESNEQPRDDRPAGNADAEPSGFDASLLPPAINVSKSVADEADAEEAAPAPRRRTRRPKAEETTE